MNSRSLVVLALAVLAICLGAIWFLNAPTPPAGAPIAPEVTAPAPTPAKTVRVQPPITPVQTAAEPSVEEPTMKPKEAPPALAEWELRIDQVLRSNADESQTAQILINLLPTLPAEGQTEAAQHISNLILDKDYNRVLPLVKNPSLTEEVLDVFVTDLMNREDNVKLPVLLEIAKIPNHPHHEEAQTDLQIFLDEDFGQDWVKWDAAMKLYLKKQADEEAAADKEATAPVLKK